MAATGALWAVLSIRPALAAITRVDLAVLRAIAHLRTPPVTRLVDVLDGLGSSVTIRVVAWSTVAVLIVFRRFAHLFTYLVALLVVSFAEIVMCFEVGRPRPVGPAILGPWDGYSFPSRPVAGLALVLVGAVYTMVPRGVWRRRWTWVAGAALACLVAARLYLGTDHPTDVAAGLVVGWVLPATIFGFATPDEAFPVSYRPGRRAHLDIGGRRGAAIRQALDQQLGLTLVSVEPYGLGGSAGSTPLRLRVRGGRSDGEALLFGKLYAFSHLRSDRFYKLVRSTLYGRLEDEAPFSGVRRLVEYEDHLLRLFRDFGLPAPSPRGLVEITPEREYLIVMQWFPGCEEVGRRPLSVEEIDDGLLAVRRMWDVGIAHRDIKPSNLLVGDGRIRLVDVAFGAVRPTPWRQAVDLSNMMLTLALASSAPQVYARALLLFTADDVAEAFAACRGVTIPAQLKARLHVDGRGLIEEFRRLAPPQRPVAIQRWSVRRLGLILGVTGALAVIVSGSAVYLRAAGLL